MPIEPKPQDLLWDDLVGSPFRHLALQLKNRTILSESNLSTRRYDQSSLELTLDIPRKNLREECSKLYKFLREYQDSRCRCTSVAYLATQSHWTLTAKFSAFYDWGEMNSKLEAKGTPYIPHIYVRNVVEFSATEEYYDVESEPYEDNPVGYHMVNDPSVMGVVPQLSLLRSPYGEQNF